MPFQFQKQSKNRPQRNGQNQFLTKALGLTVLKKPAGRGHAPRFLPQTQLKMQNVSRYQDFFLQFRNIIPRNSLTQSNYQGTEEGKQKGK